MDSAGQVERDDAMRAALERAAASVRPHPMRKSFLERLLEDAVAEEWTASTGGSAAPRCQLSAAGWNPEPGQTDLVLGLRGDPTPTVIAELKVLDVEETLWDALKLLSVAEHDPRGVRAYLIVATTPKRWRDAEVAALYAPPDRDAPEGIRGWVTEELLTRWRRSWRHLLGGGRARPRDLPGRLQTRFLGAYRVPAFPDHELRGVALEPLGAEPRLRFGPNGWPLSAGSAENPC
jgi:hypothetical protein